MKAYTIKNAALGFYLDQTHVREIDFADVERWTRTPAQWGDNRHFLVANMTDGIQLGVMQSHNPDSRKALAKISKQFRHSHHCVVQFVRNDLTTNVTDAIDALMPEDVAVYDRIVSDIDKAFAEARAKAARPWDPIPWKRPLASAYPADSLKRLRACEFITVILDTVELKGDRVGWTPKAAIRKLKRLRKTQEVFS